MRLKCTVFVVRFTGFDVTIICHKHLEFENAELANKAEAGIDEVFDLHTSKENEPENRLLATSTSRKSMLRNEDEPTEYSEHCPAIRCAPS